jgi:hypothetical protein
MEKSQDVSKLSLDFYKNAKKANKRCCSLYWFDFILKYFRNIFLLNMKTLEACIFLLNFKRGSL